MIVEKEELELKMFYNHYLDKRKELLKSTQLKVEDIFVMLFQYSLFDQKKNKSNNFLAKLM